MTSLLSIPIPELIMFDLDGTLIEFHREFLFSETHRVLKKLDYLSVNNEELQSHFSAFDYFKFIPENERDRFKEVFWEHFDWSNFPKPIPLIGIHEALSLLKDKGIKLVIVTSRCVSEAILREELQASGLLEFISHIWTRPNQSVHWTDKTGIIKTACVELNIDPNLSLMVGDVPTDILSAKDVGVGSTVAVLSGGIRSDVLEAANPDGVFKDVCEIAAAMPW